ncbi:hypothetical protein [Prevotella veroralis]
MRRHSCSLNIILMIFQYHPNDIPVSSLMILQYHPNDIPVSS